MRDPCEGHTKVISGQHMKNSGGVQDAGNRIVSSRLWLWLYTSQNKIAFAKQIMSVCVNDVLYIQREFMALLNISINAIVLAYAHTWIKVVSELDFLLLASVLCDRIRVGRASGEGRGDV